IGTESADHNTIYIGHGRWMGKESYKTAMDVRRATLFINTMALYIFGSDTLIKSTMTGATSRRSKHVPNHVEKPLKLPHDGIMILRDMYKHFLNTSEWYKNLNQLSKDSLVSKLKEYLTRFISNMKASKSRKNKKNDTIKEAEIDPEHGNNKEKNTNDGISVENRDNEVPEDDNDENHSRHIYPKIVINEVGHKKK
ncbi:hypothetical protein KQX54_000032, partial [Cotesia glomerata]